MRFAAKIRRIKAVIRVSFLWRWDLAFFSSCFGNDATSLFSMVNSEKVPIWCNDRYTNRAYVTVVHLCSWGQTCTLRSKHGFFSRKTVVGTRYGATQQSQLVTAAIVIKRVAANRMLLEAPAILPNDVLYKMHNLLSCQYLNIVQYLVAFSSQCVPYWLIRFYSKLIHLLTQVDNSRWHYSG